MKHLSRSIGLATAFAAVAASAQTAQEHHPRAEARTERRTLQESAPAAQEALRGAFRDYQRFNPDEPRKNWRAANDEVRAAGGHMGLMKASQPPAAGHERHAPAAASEGPKK